MSHELYMIKPLALGIRVFYHLAFTGIIKVLSVKGMKPPEFKQLCQIDTETSYIQNITLHVCS